MWKWLWAHKKVLFALVVVTVVIVFVVGFNAINTVRRSIVERFETADAVNNDYINWAGRLENGSYMLYMLNIHDSGYCLRDRRVAEMARKLGSMRLWVDMQFQSIYAMDIFDNFLCEPSTERSETYRVLDLQLSLEAWHELKQWQWDILQPYDDIISLPPRPES